MNQYLHLLILRYPNQYKKNKKSVHGNTCQYLYSLTDQLSTFHITHTNVSSSKRQSNNNTNSKVNDNASNQRGIIISQCMYIFQKRVVLNVYLEEICAYIHLHIFTYKKNYCEINVSLFTQLQMPPRKKLSTCHILCKYTLKEA